MKTTTQHTPGPWNISKVSADIYAADALGLIARAPPFADEHPEWPANARLIAAAPELLAALQDVMSDPYFAAAASRYQHARAAIAKATEAAR